MKDQWTSRLSEYLDDELQSAERQALEAHLDSCVACRQTLDELRRVVAQAAALNDRSLKKDLWPGIARRIGVSVSPVVHDLDVRRRARERRRFTFTVPQLAAAAMAFLFAGGGAVLMIRGQRTAIGDQPTADSRPPVRLVGLLDSTAQYDASVAQLQQALAAGRGKLDTVTVRVLEQNLALIDKAIADARAALAADPSSTYLSMHLAQTMRTKLELLRRAQAIAVRT